MVKASKTLNPADKARREARKKELKKNKKQRQQVRSAAIEQRDPEKIMADLEKLDSLEFDISINPSLCDTLYKDKRKRLKETWSKVLSYYQKEDPEKHTKLKKLENDYENKYKQLAREAEAIKAAQEVRIEEVFLPPDTDQAMGEIDDDDPLLSESMFITPLDEGTKPPGCPPGLPPDLSAIVDGLKSSLASSIQLKPQNLPFDLSNLQIPAFITAGLSQQHTTRWNKRRSNSVKPAESRPANKGVVKPDNKGSEMSLIEAANSGSVPKATVIESKPVIFKPKATVFVPSSVRSKIVRQEPTQ